MWKKSASRSATETLTLRNFLKHQNNSISTGGITIVGVDANEDSLLLKSLGAISHLPISGVKSASFQRATDASVFRFLCGFAAASSLFITLPLTVQNPKPSCFISRGRILVIVSKQFAFCQRRSASGSAERASPKVGLQLETRRVFSTPFAAGGDLLDEEGQGSVGECVCFLPCFFHAPDLPKICI